MTGKHLCWSLLLTKLQAFRTATLLKRESNRGIFLSNLQNVFEHLFKRTSANDCFWNKNKKVTLLLRCRIDFEQDFEKNIKRLKKFPCLKCVYFTECASLFLVSNPVIRIIHKWHRCKENNTRSQKLCENQNVEINSEA